MRKFFAAARRFPFKGVRFARMKTRDDKALFGAKMFGERPRKLSACAQMDKTVAGVMNAAGENTCALEVFPLIRAEYFEDKIRHRPCMAQQKCGVNQILTK